MNKSLLALAVFSVTKMATAADLALKIDITEDKARPRTEVSHLVEQAIAADVAQGIVWRYAKLITGFEGARTICVEYLDEKDVKNLSGRLMKIAGAQDAAEPTVLLATKEDCRS